MVTRCEWCVNSDIEIAYHDKEWGVPVHDDRLLFEYLVLEGVQAGLSWSTVLKKRENYRKAYDNFDPVKVARYDLDKIQELMQNEGIIRNMLKVKASIINAQEFLKIQREFGSFDKYIWQFTDGKTIHNEWESVNDIPTSSKESDAMSLDLKKRNFRFVGTTICYAFMQAVGMVNDHVIDCFRYSEIRIATEENDA